MSAARQGNRYRAAIIGLGFIGGADPDSGRALGQRLQDLDGTHAEAYLASDRFDLVGGSSRDEGRRSRFESRTGARSFADWRCMVDELRPDVVSVARYAPDHAPITEALASAGVRAIYCEKPIATTVADAARMVAATRAAGCLLAINHNRRFNPVYRQLRARLDAGELGRLTSAGLRWGTGRLGNVGTHLIDALCMLTRQLPAAVSGTLDESARPDCRGDAFRDPGGWGVLRLDGGLMATIDAADFGSGRPTITVYGVDGRLTTGMRAAVLEWNNGRREEFPAPVEPAMLTAVNEIAAWLDGEGDWDYPPSECVAILGGVTAFHLSHTRNAAWVKLPLSEDERRYEVRSG